MACRRLHPILPLLALVLLSLILMRPPAAAAASLPGAPMMDPAAAALPARAATTPSLPDPLEQRLEIWPAWSLPAPLPRPGRGDLIWPAWFWGEWEVSSTPMEGAEPPLRWRARFLADGNGGAVADRAFNASQIGAALLGDQLLGVRNDPANPNRQVARLRGDRQLESTVVGRRSVRRDGASFLADELTLLVLHGPDNPRISRVEVLGVWQRLEDGSITGEQWQASYTSPAEGLAAAAENPQRYTLRLVPLRPGSDHASGTGAPAAGDRQSPPPPDPPAVRPLTPESAVAKAGPPQPDRPG